VWQDLHVFLEQDAKETPMGKGNYSQHKNVKKPKKAKAAKGKK
jgi:hypothetical protein